MANEVFGDDDFDDDLEQRRTSGGLSGKKLALFIVLPLLLIAGILAAAYFSGIADQYIGQDMSGPEKERAASQAQRQAQQGQTSGTTSEVVEAETARIFVPLDQMLVNLQSTGRQQHFLRMRIVLAVPQQGDADFIERRKPVIMDQVQVYLRELTPEQLQGSSGIDRLRTELKTRIDKAIEPASVNDVLFQEILVQ